MKRNGARLVFSFFPSAPALLAVVFSALTAAGCSAPDRPTGDWTKIDETRTKASHPPLIYAPGASAAERNDEGKADLAEATRKLQRRLDASFSRRLENIDDDR